ncbi:hypothetical protein L9F63_007578, partial [Diploptera punctata]
MLANISTSTVNTKELYFGWLDTTIFVLMLASSTMIGIYFGIWGKREDTPKEYLHGGKKMSTVPVAVSLVASFISGIMVMGAPTEIYLYGINYLLICFSIPLVGAATYYIYLPVFYDLQLTSTYEYLQLRFNRSVRVMASILCTISLLLYIPIVVYVPALAFSQVSGMNVHFITPALSVLCIFYTMIGGIKAVVWTDFLQGVLMLVSGIGVIILGVVKNGGFGTVWERNLEGGRLNVDFNPSPFSRLTFWSTIFGNAFYWTGVMAINQAMVQKFLSLPSFNKARTSLILFVIFLIMITFVSCLSGIVIYATYYDCDPVKSKTVSRPDQVLPYFAMDVARSVPGLPGLFVAGIFSASLSTMSSCLNALGATLFDDFVRPCLKNKISDKMANNIIKCVIIGVGAVCVLIVFIVDKLGSVLQLNLSMAGVTNGALVGLFSLGMFIPRANSKGALVGSISSIVLMGWIVFGTQNAMANGDIKQPLLPFRTDGCDVNVTYSDNVEFQESNEEVFILYKLSFLYYSLIGIVIVLVIGTIVSYFTEQPEEKQMDPILFTPIIRKFMERRQDYECTESAEKEFLNYKPEEFSTCH